MVKTVPLFLRIKLKYYLRLAGQAYFMIIKMVFDEKDASEAG